MNFFLLIIISIKYIFININTIKAHSCLNQQLISAYFKFKYLNTGTIFHCSRNKELINLYRMVSSEFKINALFIERNYTKDEMEIYFLRKYKHIAVIVDGCCPNLNFMFTKYADMKAMYDTYHWLMITNKNVNYSALFEGVYMNINTDFNVAKFSKDYSYITYDVYNQAARNDGELKVALIGNYSRSVGYNVPYLGNKIWARRNMTGAKFKSAIVIPQPINITVSQYIDNQNNRDTNSMNRFQSHAIRHCRDMYNFSLTVERTDSWGYLFTYGNNGSFNGLVGLLQRKEIDFGSSPLINKYDRIPVVDYSYGNWILRSVYIYRPPRGTASSLEIFLRPFTWDVWVCTFFLGLFIVIALKLVICFEWNILKDFGAEIDTTWSYMVLFVISAFTFQGMDYQPNLASARMFIIFLFLFAILLYQFYAGYLVSYLLMDPPRVINNLADLLHSSLRVGIEDNLIDRDYFVQTTDPVARDIFTQKVTAYNQSGFYKAKEGLRMVLDGGFALHIESSSAYPIIIKTFPPKIVCKLEEVQMYRTQPMHTNLQKHSPFKEMLNHCMFRLVENGQMFRLRKHWDTPPPKCIAADRSVEITVGLAEFSCALMVLTAGLIFGLLFFGLELCFQPKSHTVTAEKRIHISRAGSRSKK